MFTKRRLKQHVYNRLECGNKDLAFSAFYVPTPVDNFSFEKVINPGLDDSFTHTSDVAMLFNQKRLDRCSRDALIQHFNSMARTNSKFAQIRSKLNDDQLMSIVKSRYIQSPSELLAYSEALVHEYGVELASLSQHITVDPHSGQTTVDQPSGATPNPVSE